MAKKQPPEPVHGGFGALADALRARGLAPTPSTSPPEPALAEEAQPPETVAAPASEAPGGRMVVRRETKGRRGKTVTTIQRLPLRGSARDAWISKLKAKLGTGASLDGETIVVQGDHVARVTALLAEEGL